MVINLGEKVKDQISGFEGTVVCRAEWINGCVRCIVQPPVGEDGKMPDNEWIDEQQLEVLTPVPAVEKAPTGGPQNMPKQRW